MPSTFRIPRNDMSSPFGRLVVAICRRLYGEVPDNAYVLAHDRKVAWSVFGFERKVAGWDALDPHLKSYAVMASAAVIGCSWCLDFGYYVATRTVSTSTRSGRCRAGASPTSSHPWSARSWATPRR
ncbi:hypothetical protein [Janibacter indicus]|uniref:hypothetical protein n=1 Tax=Janibacter indicus TaxID=857417 RepID=UPI003EB77D56